jgi:hypothetical protein
MAYEYSTDLTAEEKALLKQYSESQNAGGFGSLVGTGLGLLTGGIATIASGGTAAPLIPVLMGAGGSIGGLIGGQVGASQGESALQKLQKLREAREKPSIEKQARMEAFQRLLGPYNKYGV